MLSEIEGLHILASNVKERLGVVSFYIDGLHYNLGVKILNDKYGIQVRGGCSCAGTYGHYLLHVLPDYSKSITDKIDHGDLSDKPGWIRLSIHPVMTDEEIYFIGNAIKEMANNFPQWKDDYDYVALNNNFVQKQQIPSEDLWKVWFSKKLR